MATTLKQLVKYAQANCGKVVFNDQASALIKEFLEGIKESLEQDTPVVIKGFGTFKKVRRAERKSKIGFGPRAGQIITTPAHDAVVFKPNM